MSRGQAPESRSDGATAPADPGPYRRAAWKVRLAVGVFSVALLLVAAESLARRFGAPDAPPVFQEHPLLGVVPTPGGLVNASVTSEQGVSYRLDRFGLRGAALTTREKPKDVYRILFLGDEQTFAANTPEADTFAGRVQGELEKVRNADDLRIEVGNAGLPGASSPVLAAHLVHRLLGLQPDLVVLSCCAGDLRLSQRLPVAGSLDTFEPRPRASASGWDWLAGVSELVRLLRSHVAAPTPELSGPPLGSPDTARGLAITRRYVHLMAMACKDARCELALLTEPALWKNPLSPEERRALRWPTATGEKGPGSAEELRAALETWNEDIRSTAHREGATLVDLSPVEVVPRNLSHFSSDLELTPVGHAVVARAIVNIVFADKPATRRP